ncbi:hypothetical protein N7532_001874 [Penicillium argentinense]|uniref:D-lactate dehydratase n=1 Tax=Penicillium argentinense TaxID=1131581 RepID=A0A9W9G3C1_9EURO|nr:uncharacterized protein N7532_001874 [Penicillium argentinense]KAJ5111339.1 hypothetical protein N7532_001874 [Penicillium argentinense]
MAPKVLVVLTSHDTIPSTGKPTGWFLPEFAHPHHVLNGKVDLTIASPKGGEAPSTRPQQSKLWKETHKLADIVPRAGEFDAIFYVGGHGPMFDLTNDQTSIGLIETFAKAKKPISAVCHAPCVFLNTKAPSGEALISGKTVTGFSNDEEDQVQLSAAMPFMLETELDKISGGKYVKAAEPWGEKVCVETTAGIGGPLITGQNPASAAGVGEALLKALGL